jgi:hypothetical protein
LGRVGIGVYRSGKRLREGFGSFRSHAQAFGPAFPAAPSGAAGCTCFVRHASVPSGTGVPYRIWDLLVLGRGEAFTASAGRARDKLTPARDSQPFGAGKNETARPRPFRARSSDHAREDTVRASPPDRNPSGARMGYPVAQLSFGTPCVGRNLRGNAWYGCKDAFGRPSGNIARTLPGLRARRWAIASAAVRLESSAFGRIYRTNRSYRTDPISAACRRER